MTRYVLARLAVLGSCPRQPEPPTTSEILGGFPAPAWLTESAEHLGTSPRWIDRVTAVGLLARCWAPRDAESLLHYVRENAVLPRERARAWIVSMSETTRGAVLALALLGCEQWEIGSDPSSLRRDRDDLESLRWLLAETREGRVLATELALLDAGATAMALCACTLDDTDEQATEMSWMAPEAWWWCCPAAGAIACT